MIVRIIGILSEYVRIGFIWCSITFTLGIAVYSFFYRKRLNGRKKLTLNQIGLYSAFIIYVAMVLEETIISREPIYGGIPLEVFTSYKNAIYSGECTNIILNIVMFVPLGLMLPLISKKYEKWYRSYLVGLLATVFIELTQYITMRGIVEVDDVINNFLGCGIGYGLIMIFLSIRRKNYKIIPLIIYQVPLVLTITSINIIFQINYNLEKLLF